MIKNTPFGDRRKPWGGKSAEQKEELKEELC